MARKAKGSRTPSEDNEGGGTMRMSRGVSQLLYHYLPYKTVDWDDGRAIVQLAGLQLRSAWSDDRVAAVLAEISSYLQNWTRDGGALDPNFPDPSDPLAFTIGEPTGINANLFRTAFRCRRCSRLYFPQGKHTQLPATLTCTSCNQASLRQFPFVFVHGCGEIHPIEAFLPTSRRADDGSWELKAQPRLKCRGCGDLGEPAIMANSERVRDMRVVCLRCNQQIQQRLDANCPRCFKRLLATPSTRAADPEDRAGGASIIQRTAMRVARYSQNETYYPATISILRLDRPDITVGNEDPRLAALVELLPPEQRAASTAPSHAKLAALVAQLKRAEEVGDKELHRKLLRAIGAAATGSSSNAPPSKQVAPEEDGRTAPEDIVKSARESRALLTTVAARSAIIIATEAATPERRAALDTLSTRLGFSELSVVSDLPIISCTFGYTRRSFAPTYDELSATGLPTELRAFPGLDRYAAQRMASPGAEGTVPLPAREGEHEGLFFTLVPGRVLRWLEANGIETPGDNETQQINSLLRTLEPIDRFHDRIWGTRTRKYLFGLVHTMSHVIMRAAARFAGMERTSLSEYIFLPLLGGVAYDNASVFQLGGLRTLARDNLDSFLEAVTDEAVRCMYDPDCTDHRGACHGCIHSPEICCRVFNHGLSRSFLLGGHAPWADVATDEALVGFWDVD